jgi:hypothetical protein
VLPVAPTARSEVPAERSGHDVDQRTSRSSTSNSSVALGGMMPPAPRAP